ncbi:MAG: diguanylate cyclase, partial [Thermodesulfobacteriota bacterium]
MGDKGDKSDKKESPSRLPRFFIQFREGLRQIGHIFSDTKKMGKTSKRSLRKYQISRVINPKKWSLNARFVWFLGLLLLAGLAITYFFVSYTLDKTLRSHIGYRLESFNSRFEQGIERKKKELLKEAVQVISIPGVLEAIENQDPEALQSLILPYNEKVRLNSGTRPVPMQFYLPQEKPLLSTWSLKTGIDSSQGSKDIMGMARENMSSVTGMGITSGGLIIAAAFPLVKDGNYLGGVEAVCSLDRVFSDLELSNQHGLIVTLNESVAEKLPKSEGFRKVDGRCIIAALGNLNLPEFIEVMRGKNIIPSSIGSYRISNRPVSNYNGEIIGSVYFFLDATGQLAKKKQNLSFFLWFGVMGTAFFWIFLYLNVKRIKDFLDRMKKILVASHFNDFADRFETDAVHCLEILHCHNVECPVHQDPSRVCYLETGDEAISPKWRDTCIFLNKYDTCRNCPVYQMRHGDELMETRHMINTMMLLWSQFLGHIGQLLSEVFRTRPGGMPSLDQVSDYLEQMARLTTFAHDLQGVYDKKEVFMHLEHAFKSTFGLSRFLLLEVDFSENRMHPAINCGDLETHAEVFLNCDLCRAKRISEEVISANNPMLCPYFSVKPETHVRCCLPMVMSGQVGAVFSFVMPKMEWENKKENVQFIRKYLEETAPVLSSLRLLQISRDKSLRDPLTGAYNRRFMDEYLAQTEILSKRQGKRLGFIMADLDHFKMVNDQYGHQAGDSILEQVVGIIHSNIRRSDLVVRYGGEEFLILLVDPTTEGDTEEVAEKIRKAVESQRFRLPSEETIQKTISLGISEFPEDATQLYQTIKYADVALYEAKNKGRNCSLRFKPYMWT